MEEEIKDVRDSNGFISAIDKTVQLIQMAIANKNNFVFIFWDFRNHGSGLSDGLAIYRTSFTCWERVLKENGYTVEVSEKINNFFTYKVSW